MSIYSSQRKAIYLSPNRLELLHRRGNLNDLRSACQICAVESGRITWLEFADWLSGKGFKVEKARPQYITLAAPGIPYTRFGWMQSCRELDRLLELLESEHATLAAPVGGQGA